MVEAFNFRKSVFLLDHVVAGYFLAVKILLSSTLCKQLSSSFAHSGC